MYTGGPAARIAPATWRDLSAIHRLEKRCFGPDAWPWFDVLAALTFAETVRFKAMVDEVVVGFIVGDRRRRQNLGWIATVGVHPDHRRRGIAATLLAHCEQEMGMPRVRLTLRRSNQAAWHLYEKAGYHQIEVWPRYYRDGEDGVVMEKKLRLGEIGGPPIS
jgi:ribosomal-protein-alanine N-acetyltransferase